MCTQIWNDINTKIETDNYIGYLICDKIDSSVYFSLQDYKNGDIYRWAYTSTNDPKMNDAVKLQSTTGNSADNTVTFTSNDSTDVTEWTEMSALESEEKHSSIFNKISIMFKNIRYLYKMITEQTAKLPVLTTGTVTWNIHASNNNAFCYKFGRIVVLSFSLNTSQVINNNTTILTVPIGFRPITSIPFPFMKAGYGMTYNANLDINGTVYLPNNNLEIAWYNGIVAFISEY